MTKFNQENTAIIFPGQGSQAVGMGRDLFLQSKNAKLIFENIDEILGYKLSQIIFEGPNELLLDTTNTQPALMAVSIALINVIEKDFGYKFSKICSLTAGHSLGEYSALCASNALSLEDSTKLLKIRSQEMAKCSKKYSGAMAAIIGSDFETIQQITKDASKNEEICQIANDNSLSQIVISGNKEAVERAINIAKEKGIKKAIMLAVSGAFHSQLMKDAELAMAIALNDATIRKPEVAIISNVSATINNDPETIKSNLIKQISGSVRWRETIELMAKNNISNIVEIGNGKVLTGLTPRCVEGINNISIQNYQDIENFITLIN